MIALWTATLAVGLTALALGLVGLVSGRIDRRVLTNRRRLTVLAAVGLLLVFAGSAPPTRGAASQTALPDDTRSVPIRTLLEQLGTRAVLRSDTDVLPEQQAAYEAWERQVVAGYEKAEQSLAAVPNVMNALHENQLDRFTAWVHLARLKQDTNQVRLAVDAVDAARRPGPGHESAGFRTPWTGSTKACSIGGATSPTSSTTCGLWPRKSSNGPRTSWNWAGQPCSAPRWK